MKKTLIFKSFLGTIALLGIAIYCKFYFYHPIPISTQNKTSQTIKPILSSSRQDNTLPSIENHSNPFSKKEPLPPNILHVIPKNFNSDEDHTSLEYRTSAKASLENGIFSGGMTMPDKSFINRTVLRSINGFDEYENLSKNVAYEKAQKKAQDDFENDRYLFLYAGLHTPDEPFENYLFEQYGVLTGTIVLGRVTEGIIGTVEGYNTQMKVLLIQKMGKDIFQEATEKTHSP
ncbi:MAG: hypothetical protein V4507_02655 [Verrucomicrobiota bacterium]